MKRGRKPRVDWDAVLKDAVARDLTAGQIAREQGCPYGTVYSAADRLGINLNVDGRVRRWDGIRTRDRIKSLSIGDNLQECSEYTLGDLSQNQRVRIPGARPVTNPDVVYVIEEAGCEWCKVGVSASNDIDRRIRELRSGNPRELQIIFKFEHTNPRQIERMVHGKLWRNRAGLKVRTEWFQVPASAAIAAIHEAASEVVPGEEAA